MRRINDFSAYTGVLPYASEVFGVYQPLIGWRSARTRRRIRKGFDIDRLKVSQALLGKLTPEFELRVVDGQRMAAIVDARPAALRGTRLREAGTFLGEAIAEQLPPPEEYDESAWDVLEPDALQALMEERAIPRIEAWQRDHGGAVARTASPALMMADQIAKESKLAGLLLHLKDAGHLDALQELFYRPDLHVDVLKQLLEFRDPLDYIDPHRDIDRAGLSPLGIVHLFRQYFYEFDTFLGPPVGHVWVAPGSTVELVEVQTRRTLIERAVEHQRSMASRIERHTTAEDEIAEAVKEDNRSDTRFGMNATVNQSWVSGEATASNSLDLDTTQQRARESTHRRMRQQSETLSSEIRSNFSSTFRTVTETTDVSSSRHVLTNPTGELLNYELRRKMRQVGVQVQDIGTYLCWQTYVDDPGRDLGIAKLVHIAKDPELGAIPNPDRKDVPEDHVTRHELSIPFEPRSEDTTNDDRDETYRDGKEVNLDDADGDAERIKWRYRGNRVMCDLAGYEFVGLEFEYGGHDIRIDHEVVDTSRPGEITYDAEVRHVNFHGAHAVVVHAVVTWRPTKAMRDEIEQENIANAAAADEAKAREFRKAYLESARDRIEKAGEVRTRPFEDLREEERIVVYRALVQEMLTRGIPMPDDRTRHVVSELLNTIFDIDKMLYFVAPEWWRPRQHRGRQSLGLDRSTATPTPVPTAGGALSSIFAQVKQVESAGVLDATALKAAKALQASLEDTTISSSSVVTWGGVGEGRAASYYVTEASEPAPLGASLGWLLQLDGDDMRNAFLNAPWVKAVIPVRPGKERAAMNWLARMGVEGAEGLDDRYVAPAGELAKIPHEGEAPTIRDAVLHLCERVAAKHEAANEVGAYPPEEIDDASKVMATPIDKVYEHGFYPLQGGFRVEPAEEGFELFDQWVEVLPTDQVVPVEVEYDPVTGRQI